MFDKKYSFYIVLSFVSIFFLASCQVSPVYQYNSVKKLIDLNAITIAMATTPIEQKVRNNLLFLISKGTTESRLPRYKLTMKVTSDVTDVLLVNSSDRAQSGRITVKAIYVLQQLSDEKIIHKNSAFAISLLDFSEQEFSKIRAIKIAEDRAAKELAENINNDLINVINSLH